MNGEDAQLPAAGANPRRTDVDGPSNGLLEAEQSQCAEVAERIGFAEGFADYEIRVWDESLGVNVKRRTGVQPLLYVNQKPPYLQVVGEVSRSDWG